MTGAAAATAGAEELPETAGGMSGDVSDYLPTLKALLDAVDPRAVGRVADLVYGAFRDGRRLVLCGNGGSGSTASHLACDFAKNVLLDSGRAFEVVALSDSPAAISAWANDTDYANVFAGQARTWLRAGDVLIALSGSGNSANVLRAVEVAREVGATSVGFCGYGGGALAERADISIVVDRRNMQQVEDLHMVLGHIVFSAVRDRVKGRLAA